MQCKNFRWYLDNVFPEHEMPLSSRHIGQIRNVETRKCLDAMEYHAHSLKMKPCTGNGDRQLFVVSNLNEIKTGDECIHGHEYNSSLKLRTCNGKRGKQQWIYNEQVPTFYFIISYIIYYFCYFWVYRAKPLGSMDQINV